MELIVGARDKRDVGAIDTFLSCYPIIPLSDRIGSIAYRLLMKYSKSHALHIFDSVIAATALESGFTLVTLNRKHYHMIEDLQLEVPTY